MLTVYGEGVVYVYHLLSVKEVGHRGVAARSQSLTKGDGGGPRGHLKASKKMCKKRALRASWGHDASSWPKVVVMERHDGLNVPIDTRPRSHTH